MVRICCAEPKAKTMLFKLFAPQAKRVTLAGTFNNWDTKGCTAKRDAHGNWIARISLKPGRYEYKFFVDGSWMSDPHCGHCITNTFGTQNCTIVVK